MFPTPCNLTAVSSQSKTARELPLLRTSPTRSCGPRLRHLALLPIGDNFTMGPFDALRAVKLINPRRVIPIHYNTWDIIAQDAEAWAQQVRDQTECEPVVLKPGGSIAL